MQIFDVNDSYFTSKIAIGGPSGRRFYFGLNKRRAPRTGTVVRSLRAWYAKKTMRGLEVELTNGRSRMFGVKAGTSTEKFYLGGGEKVASLKIWPTNFRKGRSGGFELVTNQNRRFNVPVRKRKGNPYEPELGSGILIGVFGTAGSDIDSLGFALLRRVQSAELIELKYPDLSTLLIATSPKEIKCVTYDNSKGKAEQSFTFAGSERVEASESWSVTSGLEVGVSTTVKAGVPLIAEVSTTVTVTVSVSGTYGRSNTHTTEQSFNFPVAVPAGKRVQATATLYEGNINTRYTAKMMYILDSGKKFSYAVSGIYDGISASQVIVTAKSY